MWHFAYESQGFDWIDADNAKQSIISFVRRGKKPTDDLVVIINFDPASYETFRMGVPREGDWKLVFNTDDPAYGGSGYQTVEMASSQPVAWNGRKDSIEISLPGMGGLVYKRVRKSSYVPPKEATKTRARAVAKRDAATEHAAGKREAAGRPSSPEGTADKTGSAVSRKPAAPKASGTRQAKKPAAKHPRSK